MYYNNSSYAANTTSLNGEIIIYLSAENIFVSIFAIAVTFVTVFGNTLVVLAVLTERRLRKVSNVFIVNLAVSDLLVGLFVTPMAAISYVTEYWSFGVFVCDLFISLDVICCTASICSLCVISIDRYKAITQPLKYALKRTPQRAAVMVAIVWFVALAVALPPLFGWREDRSSEITECLISQEESYTIYSTVGAFYLPLFIMVGVYLKIFQAIKNRRKKFLDHGDVSTTQVHLTSTSDKNKHSVNAEQMYPLRRLRKETGDSKTKTEVVHPQIGYRLSKQQSYSLFVSEDEIDSDDDMTVIPLPETALTCSNSYLTTLAAIQLQRNLTMSNPDLVQITAKKVRKKACCGKGRRPKKPCLTPALRNRRSIYNKQVSFAKQLSFRLKTSRSCSVSGKLACNGKVNVKFKRKYRSPIIVTPPEHTSRSSSSRDARISVSQEKKAAKTLGIIMGTFIFCWLPFFIMALVLPFCKEHCQNFPIVVMDIFTWLGYMNSALNPLIYTFFNLEFRKAFNRILRCKCSSYSY
ncbi:5-hydroxytryptamine receptor 1A-alpha-like [Saccoglossus kowalevskii]|uniref:5-hydroxytryptamine receptor 1A-alpha-like n=1 Tax=Saccoglossus kowalevskii TaxID=10224 RepID=A0ABM0MKZ9_SACKO|nr:PREDICTED: 5-hydroxytryptamine receptor 1A-alpha-like [Saccoglossus kowalevskii]